MGKQDSYPPKPTLIGTDYVTGVDSTGPSSIKVLISAILNFVWTLANIPAGGTSPITRDSESQVNFVKSGGLVWSGDAYGSTLLASMTAGFVYINGLRISIGAVAHRAFTASDDTYVDILSNGDGTGTLVYTTVANNAAAPTLAANSIRVGRINAGATNIAAASSVIQYGNDSLGNYIYNISATAQPVLLYTQGGSGGGVGYYRNQNGVKECWGQSGTFSTTNGNNYTASYPSGFFNVVQYGIMTVSNGSATLVYLQNSTGIGGTSAYFGTTASSVQMMWYARGF